MNIEYEQGTLCAIYIVDTNTQRVIIISHSNPTEDSDLIHLIYQCHNMLGKLLDGYLRSGAVCALSITKYFTKLTPC